MKRMIFGITVAVLALVLVTSSDVFAGGRNRIGTAGASELLIPVGARDVAMSGATTANTSGIEAIFWNPAGLARAESDANVMFSFMPYFADIDVTYVAVSANFRKLGSLALSVKALSFGNIAVTTEDFPDGTGETTSPTFFTLGLTYSRILADRISVGATANVISERLDRVSATGVAFNFGVQYRNLGDIKGLNVGVAVKNVGGDMKFDGSGLLRAGQVDDVTRAPSFFQVEASSFELPSTIEIGVSLDLNFAEQSELQLASIFQNNNFSYDEYKFGAEYSYDDLLFVRGGYSIAANEVEDTYIYGATLGAGINYVVGDLDLTLDYAWQEADFLGSNNIFSVKIGF